MPTYEYRCKKGHYFDVMQFFNDDPLTKCEVCGAPVERVLHAPAVHFKGSGFYNTDYGTKKRQREQKSERDQKSAAASDSSSSSSTSDSSSKSSDSKPAEKSSGGSSSDAAKPAKAKSD